ncbi:MAG: helix-turn-helix domain-containing protein [Bacteroidota bacterium]
MKPNFRCDCPITSALDIVGDKWTLVLVKMMLLEDRQTFKDFLEGDEHIASNILSARLKMLEEYHMVTKGKRPENKKTNIYRLTDKGLDLMPIIVELALWSDHNLRDIHPILRADDSLELMKSQKEQSIQMLQEQYRTQTAQLDLI